MSPELLQPDAVERGAAAPAPGHSRREISIEERRRLVADSLRVGNPRNKSGDLPVQADPRHDCQIELAVDDIRPYANNPRRMENPRFAEIKESIRSSGIRNPLTVTRRPGDEHFIVEAGGNTRLLAIQQLWAETREVRFQKLLVLYRPWRSDTHVLTAHLIENELRGDMTFWDKATGLVALKSRLEAERGHALSLRQLEDELKGLGLSVNTSTLAHCLFATERLRTLGEGVAGLSGLDVKRMQPRLNLMKRHAHRHATLAEDELYATVFEPVLQNVADLYRQTKAFSAAEVCEACEEALARRLGEPVSALRMTLISRGPVPQGLPETSPDRDGADRSVQAVATAPITLAHSPRLQSAVSTANAGSFVSGGEVPSGDPRSANEEGFAGLSRIIEHVQSFAVHAGIGDCLRRHAGAPLGYYMESLPVLEDEASAPPGRQQAWWLLASVAGQPDHAASLAKRAGAGDGDPLNACTVDAAFFGWLVNAHDETANAFWNLLALIREGNA